MIDKHIAMAEREARKHSGIMCPAVEANWRAIAEKLRQHEELVEALDSLIRANGGGKKDCGHDFTCVCAEDKAKVALQKARGGLLK